MTAIGYARVSTADQDLSIQEAALKAAGCEVVRAEKRSGTTTQGREELRTVLDFLRKGDVLMVKRAERRLGELMEADRKAGKSAKGNAVKGAKPGPGRGKKGQKSAGRPRTRAFKSLKKQGIDKTLADRARKPIMPGPLPCGRPVLNRPKTAQERPPRH